MSNSVINLNTLNADTILAATFSQAVYPNEGGTQFVPPAGFEKVEVKLNNPQSTGFAAETYVNKATGQVVIAYRGSDGPAEATGIAAVSAITGKWDPQFTDATNYAAKARTAAVDKINDYRTSKDLPRLDAQSITPLLTGHSLGGLLSQVTSKMFGWPAQVFDSLGGGKLVNTKEFEAQAIALGQVDAEGHVLNHDVSVKITNYAVSLASDAGIQMGSTVSIPALGQMGALPTLGAVGAFLLNPIVGLGTLYAGDQFLGKHSKFAIEESIYSLVALKPLVADQGELHMQNKLLFDITGQSMDDGNARTDRIVPTLANAQGQAVAYIDRDSDGVTKIVVVRGEHAGVTLSLGRAGSAENAPVQIIQTNPDHTQQIFSQSDLLKLLQAGYASTDYPAKTAIPVVDGSNTIDSHVQEPADLLNTRNSASYITDTAANDHQVTINAGGTLSDAWAVQKDSATGFASAKDFYAAVLESNPHLTDVNNIPAGTQIYVPEKFADGSITYHYANGVSVNNNAINGEYTMVAPDGSGGTAVYSRVADEFGYTVHEKHTDASGAVTFDYSGYQETLDAPVQPHSIQWSNGGQTGQTQFLTDGSSLETLRKGANTLVSTARDSVGQVVTTTRTETLAGGNTLSTVYDGQGQLLSSTRTSSQALPGGGTVALQETTNHQATGHQIASSKEFLTQYGEKITITTTAGGWVESTVQSAGGVLRRGAVAGNGNVSFLTANAQYIFRGGEIIAELNFKKGTGSLVVGGKTVSYSPEQFSYDPKTGLIATITTFSSNGISIPGLIVTTTGDSGEDQKLQSCAVNEKGLNWRSVENLERYLVIARAEGADANMVAMCRAALTEMFLDPDKYRNNYLSNLGDYFNGIESHISEVYGKSHYVDNETVDSSEDLYVDDGYLNGVEYRYLRDYYSNIDIDTDYSQVSYYSNSDYNYIGNPMGAFYESKSAEYDTALSIANKMFRVLNSSGVGLTAEQLTALDANADGKVSGAELDGLYAWSDLNEDGVLNQTAHTNELTTLSAALASAGLSSVKSSDYAFYTAGNASYRSAAQNAAAAPVNSLVAPSALVSDYAALRSTDNQYWSAAQVKISSDGQNMVGTGGDDAFDIGYYAAYDGAYFDLSLVQNFYAGGGNDMVGGSTRNDNVWGGLGNDVLFGYAGDDKLYGEDGNDELQGSAGNDLLDGGVGEDRLFGQVGNDILVGGDSADVMVGFTASNDSKQTLAAGETDDDTMFGGNGDDQMWGSLGNDYMDGGVDNDTVAGGSGDDVLFGGAGDDQVSGDAGNDIIDGGAGADKVFGGVGNDQMWGGDGNDIMMGFTPANDIKQTLTAGETDNDLMYGAAGDDLMFGGLGNDELWGSEGGDELQGGEGSDALYGEAGKDRLFGQAGDDTIYGGDGDDVIAGFMGSNEAKQTLDPGETDNDFLYGGAGNDIILGGLGNDYIDGGAGADYMEGGKGDDIYVVNSVNDVILDQQDGGYDAVIAGASYSLNAGVEELRLIEGGAYNGTGNSLNNRIVGNSQDNILDGVTGADTMIGGLGDDTYYVDDAGDQVIELESEGTDTVNSRISYTLGAGVENLTLLDFYTPEKGVADGVDVLVYGYPKAFELDYMQGDAVPGYKATCALTSIANLGIQANQALSESQVVQRAIDNGWAVTDPTLTEYQRGGSNYADQQALLSSYGIRNGVLMGYNEQAIANLIRAGRGVIVGLNAGRLWGDDAYLDNGEVNHVITFTGVALDAVSGAINGFYIADSGRGKVSDMTRYVPIADFRADANVSNAYFIYTLDPIKLWEENINASGNDLDNVIIGNRGDNILQGFAGNDRLEGGEGSDTYLFTRGDGQDTIEDNSAGVAGVDKIVLTGINSTEAQLSRSGVDLLIKLGQGDQITAKKFFYPDGSYQIEQLVFDDGIVLSLDQLKAAPIRGTDGNDTLGEFTWSDNIIGSSQNNVLDNVTGADAMMGGLGDDTYYVDHAGDQVIEFANEGTDTVNARVSYTLGAGVENLTLLDSRKPEKGVADGVNVLVYGYPKAFKPNGVPGNASVQGDMASYQAVCALAATRDGEQAWQAVLQALPNYGFRSGVVGIYSEESIAYLIKSGRGAMIGLNAGKLWGDDAYLGSGQANHMVTVTGMALDAASGAINGFYIADSSRGKVGDMTRYVPIADFRAAANVSGAYLIYTLDPIKLWEENIRAGGNDLDNVIVGNKGDNILQGFAGNDRLEGGEGSDTYLFTRGDGQDTIEDNSAGIAGTDKIVVRGIDPAQAQLSHSGVDLLIKLGQGDQITVKKFFYPDGGSRQIEQLVFDDGTVWGLEQLKVAPIIGTDGGDVLGDSTWGVNNTYIGGKGNDIITDTAGGGDTYIFNRGDGQDTIEDDSRGTAVADKIVLHGINPAQAQLSHSGNDLVISFGQGDQITVKKFFYTDSNQIEQLVFDDGTVWGLEQLKAATLYGTDGNDTLSDSTLNADRTYVGGKGNDTITDFGGGNDTYIFARGDGQDTITDRNLSAGTDKIILHGIDAAQTQLSRKGVDLFINLGQGDQITVRQFFDATGLYQIEQLVFDDGTVWGLDQLKAAPIRGTDGNDTLIDFTFNADRMYVGGKGNDTITDTRGGSDTYIFARGDGQDTIEDNSMAMVSIDKIILHGIEVAQTQLSRKGIDLLINLDQGDQITVKNFFDSLGWNQIEQLVFDDGTVWGLEQLKAVPMRGTDGNDALSSSVSNSNDTYIGGKGNDTITDTNGGSDTYIFTRGDGQDTITDRNLSAGTDKIILHGIGVAQTQLSRSGSDLVVNLDQGDRITVKNFFYSDGSYQIEQLVFDDGTVWGLEQLKAAPIRGTDGNDALSDPAWNADDIYLGGKGNDTITDISGGSDAYIFARGDGQDTIEDNNAGVVGIDKIVLHGIESARTQLSRNGIDLLVNLDQGDQITVKKFFDNMGQNQIEQLVFDDGTVWGLDQLRAAPVRGTDGNDTLGDPTWNADDTYLGGKGNDIMKDFGGGSDTYIFTRGDGQDTIEDNSVSTASTDKIILKGISSADAKLNHIGSDLFINLGQGDQITVKRFFDRDGWYQVEQLVFDDGTVWGLDQLKATPISGTDGDDVLLGFGGTNDIYLGGKGNDTMTDNDGGSDTYIFARGDGQDVITDKARIGDIDKILLKGVAPTEVQLRRSGDGGDLIINLGQGDQITVKQFYDPYFDWYQIEELLFDNGTVWGLEQFKAAPIRGTDGNDTLGDAIWDPNDTYIGGKGNDTITDNGGGSDTYIFTRGDGQDTIEDNSIAWVSTDKIVLHGIDEAQVQLNHRGSDLVINLGQGDQITVKQFFSSYIDWYQIEQLVFDNGTIWGLDQLKAAPIRGTDGNDTLSYNGLTADSNIYIGGKGNDTITDYWGGSDTYLFARGDGQDTIADTDWTVGTDSLQFNSGINQTNLWFKHVGNDLQINVMGTVDQVTVKGWYVVGFGTDQQIERIKTAEGLTMYNTDVEKLVQAMAAFTPPSAAQTSWINGQTSNGQTLLTVTH
jgi:YD repeat-containing protein